MRKNFYFPKTFRHRKFEMSWDIKVQLVAVAAFGLATLIAYVAINFVYA